MPAAHKEPEHVEAPVVCIYIYIYEYIYKDVHTFIAVGARGRRCTHIHSCMYHTRLKHTHTGGQTSGRRILPGVAGTTGGQTSGRRILASVAGTASIVSSSVLAATNGILSSGTLLRVPTLLIHRQGPGSNSSVFSIHRTERKESNKHTRTGMRQWTAM